jgi:hypothetical protein
MTADVLSDDDLKAQLLYEMQAVLVKWKKQMNLLDRETIDIINKLEGIVATKAKGKRKEARV